MSNAFLDYTSWSFQLIVVLVVLYLVVGLIRPSWVLAAKRRTIVIVSVVILLLASTAFYVAVQPLSPASAEANAFNTQGPTQGPPAAALATEGLDALGVDMAQEEVNPHRAKRGGGKNGVRA